MIAALFVEEGGVYTGLMGVDAWPKTRDATKYKGPHPVVAHPPCQLWGNLAYVNYARWGGEHNKPGNDGGLFLFAKNAVDQYGGVLEHPAYSRAFSTYGIKTPKGKGWEVVGDNRWVCEVWQSAYGHKARKKTWLYYAGNKQPQPMRWDRPSGSHQVGWYDQRGKKRNKPTLSKAEANATPIAFRDALVDMAENAR